jgi:hypothetical protein
MLQAPTDRDGNIRNLELEKKKLLNEIEEFDNGNYDENHTRIIQKDGSLDNIISEKELVKYDDNVNLEISRRRQEMERDKRSKVAGIQKARIGIYVCVHVYI